MDIFLQVLWYSLLASAIYTLIAVGLTMTFGVLDFINFAHGGMAMVGAYLLLALTAWLHLPFWVAFVLVVALTACFGFVIEKLTFKPVRKSHPFKALILSIGVSAFLEAAVVWIFGGGVASYLQPGDSGPTTFSFFNGKLVINNHQILVMLMAVVLLAGLALFLKYSKTGKAVRAVGDNKEVAAILGINVDRTISIIFAVGTALAAIAGMLIGGEENLNPTMGLSLGVYAFVAVVLGGVGNVWGAMLGATIIGFLENFLVAYTPVATSYRSPLVFLLMIIMLMVKPSGLLGASTDAEVRK